MKKLVSQLLLLTFIGLAMSACATHPESTMPVKEPTQIPAPTPVPSPTSPQTTPETPAKPSIPAPEHENIPKFPLESKVIFSFQETAGEFYISMKTDKILNHFKKADPVLYSIAKKVGPLEEFKPHFSDNYFLSLSRGIVGQQLSNKVAVVIFDRFVKLFPKQEITPEYILKIADYVPCP